MNNTQLSADKKNNLNRQNSLDHCKWKPGTVIQCVNDCGRNLRDGDNNSNNKHLNRNRNSKSSNFHDSGSNTTLAHHRKSKIKVTWKPGSLILMSISSVMQIIAFATMYPLWSLFLDPNRNPAIRSVGQNPKKK